MGLIEAFILGLLQGVTEFLPISSTAHLRLASIIPGFVDPGAEFTAVIQLGSLFAMIVFFWTDLCQLTYAWVLSFRGVRSKQSGQAWAIILATLPICGVGWAARHLIEGSLRSLYVVAGMLIVIGFLMALAERHARSTKELGDLTWKEALAIGFFQMLALIPGASRSGTTISAGLLLGLDRESAGRFSFLLAIPSVLAAGVYQGIQNVSLFTGDNAIPTLVAIGTAGIVGFFTIKLLLPSLRRFSTIGYVYYRIILGLAILIALLSGHLSPV